MNRKQMFSMWCGIVVFVVIGLGEATGGGAVVWYRNRDSTLMFPSLFILWACIIVVTAGLIYTFRDKTPKSK